MSWSLKLFKVKGIDVKVHVTFLLILAWAAWRWSTGTGDGLRGALFGVVVTLLLFAAVTLHELGHSFQALRYGVEVRGITLLPLGGIAEMAEMPDDPRQELRIALAGPLVNVGIAALLAGVGLVLDARTIVSVSELMASLGEVSWQGLLSYLTMANLALAVFNLIPAFPMDGGRVLRALLAMRMEPARATSIATKVGQGLALALGLWGFMQGNWTLVVIAVFVWMGAGQESKSAKTEQTLGDLTVGQAMTHHPQTLAVADSLSRAVELTLTTPQADFPVLHVDGRVVGLLTGEDLLAALQKHGAGFSVFEVMRTNYPTAQADEPLADVLGRMTAARVRVLLVVDEETKLLGMLTGDDVNEAFRLLTAHPQAADVVKMAA